MSSLPNPTNRTLHWFHHRAKALVDDAMEIFSNRRMQLTFAMAVVRMVRSTTINRCTSLKHHDAFMLHISMDGEDDKRRNHIRGRLKFHALP
jgi:hypothetical protein